MERSDYTPKHLERRGQCPSLVRVRRGIQSLKFTFVLGEKGKRNFTTLGRVIKVKLYFLFHCVVYLYCAYCLEA